MLVGLSQSVGLISDIDVNFFDYFLWDFNFSDHFLDDLFNFCLFLLWPVCLDQLLDEIVVIFRKLWANVVVNTSFGFKGFDHFPFT